MKTRILKPTIVAAVFSACLSASLMAADVSLDKCPSAVQQTVKSHLNGGRIDDVDRVSVEGRTYYKVEIDFRPDQKKNDVDLYIAEDGTLLKTREDIRLDQAPAKVQEAAVELAGQSGRVNDVERETVDGKVTYRVEIDLAKRDVDLKAVIAEDGKVISQRMDD